MDFDLLLFRFQINQMSILLSKIIFLKLSEFSKMKIRIIPV